MAPAAVPAADPTPARLVVAPPAASAVPLKPASSVSTLVDSLPIVLTVVDPALARPPTVVVKLPAIDKTGPIAAARAAHLRMFACVSESSSVKATASSLTVSAMSIIAGDIAAPSSIAADSRADSAFLIFP